MPNDESRNPENQSSAPETAPRRSPPGAGSPNPTSPTQPSPSSPVEPTPAAQAASPDVAAAPVDAEAPDDLVENIEPKPLQPPGETDYDPEPARDEARKWLAFMLVWLLCGMVLLSFIFLCVLEKENFANLKALLELIFAPVIALVGTATGFYFGGGRSGKH